MTLLVVIGKRLLWTALTLWLVFSATFFLMRAVPGGPMSSEKNVPEAIKRNMEARFGLDQPVWEQYRRQLVGYLQGDLGGSFKMEDFTVAEVLAQGFPVSASLGILALMLALFGGLLAGVLSAVWRNSWSDIAIMATATLGIAVPNFVVASLLIVLFVFWLQLLPAGGWGTLQQILLPAICLAAPFGAYIARLSRASMLEVLSRDYIRTALAKGLDGRTVIVRHALQGALLPVVSYLGPATAHILTGSLVLEQVFNLPGMGSHFINAAKLGDWMVAMGATLVFTLLLAVMNLLVDLTYVLLDPRVELE